ncbi:MAG: PIN domain-containing protein [Euryarchaeota archaeon]|nr:PIN domain-containing protein [Euryarchaeota archaeon]
MKRVYLDTCVWCRLFDVIDHKKIREEFRAVSRLVDAARNGKVSIMKSEVLFYEVSKIEGEERTTVEKLIDEIATEEIKTSENTRKTYENVAKECGLKAVDALHLALAIENNVDVFLTTDDEILNRRKCIEKHGILVKNPTEYEVE